MNGKQNHNIRNSKHRFSGDSVMLYKVRLGYHTVINTSQLCELFFAL